MSYSEKLWAVLNVYYYHSFIFGHPIDLEVFVYFCDMFYNTLDVYDIFILYT